MAETATRGAELAGRLDLAPEVRLVPAAFHETYGYGATGVWRAPGSVTLLSDGAATLSMAARWGTIVATHPREDDVVELVLMNRPAERVRADLAGLRPGATEEWAAAGLSAVWALREAGYATRGVTMLAGVDLPDGAGLAASTSAACAIALALRDMYAPDLPVEDLPALVENGLRAYGATCEPGPGGGRPAPPLADTGPAPLHRPHPAPLGRAGVTLLGRDRMAYLDDGSGDALVPLDVEAAGLRLVVVDTRVRAAPASPVIERSPLREVAAYLRGGDPSALGPAFGAAQTRLDGAGVPRREQSIVVTAALGAGALGGRMIWDGPGRPVLLLLHAKDLGRIRTAVTEACVTRGLRPPRFLTVTAFGPAARK